MSLDIFIQQAVEQEGLDPTVIPAAELLAAACHTIDSLIVVTKDPKGRAFLEQQLLITSFLALTAKDFPDLKIDEVCLI